MRIHFEICREIKTKCHPTRIRKLRVYRVIFFDFFILKTLRRWRRGVKYKVLRFSKKTLKNLRGRDKNRKTIVSWFSVSKHIFITIKKWFFNWYRRHNVFDVLKKSSCNRFNLLSVNFLNSFASFLRMLFLL